MARESIVLIFGLICLLAFAFVTVKVWCSGGGPELTTGFLVHEVTTLSFIADDGSFYTFAGLANGATASFAPKASLTFNSRGFGKFFPVLTGLGVITHAPLHFRQGSTKRLQVVQGTLSVGLINTPNKKLYFQAGELHKAVIPCKGDEGKAL